MSTIPYTITNDTVAVFMDGKINVISRGSPNFEGMRKALLEGRWDDVPNHLTAGKALETWARGLFTVSGNNFKYRGEDLPQELNDRIVEMATAGASPEHLLKFWERLQKNPSRRSVQQLYGFLKHQGIPITADGCFMAYKSVTSSYKDVRTGTLDNTPGAVREMPRNQISDDPAHACHAGLHVGALKYVDNFGPADKKVIVCKVSPEDVVCVPYDADAAKMRVCKYEVVGNFAGELPSTTFEEDEYLGDDDLDDDYYDDDGDDDPGEDKEDDPQGELDLGDAKKKGHKYDGLDFDGLMDLKLEDLRRYAAVNLKMVGASKLPGGKYALVRRIMKLR